MGILDDLLEDSKPEESFDSESFLEMIVAYLPQLEGVEVRVKIDFFFVFTNPLCAIVSEVISL